MAGRLSRRSFMAGTASSVGLRSLPFAILTTGYARYHGLHLARDNAARRAAIEEMVATNRPLDLNVTGTYQIDRRIDLSAFAGRTVDLHPNCRLQSNGAGGAAHVFFSQGGAGIRIRGGILTPGSAVTAFLHGHAIYFGDATDCWVEETVVEGAVRGAIAFNRARRCGWRDPVCRHSLQYREPPADHSGLGYDFYLTGGIADFAGEGGLSEEGGGVGFSVQSLAAGGDTYERISLTGWRVVRALAYGAMLYRNSDAVRFKDIVLYGDLIDTVYGNVPSKVTGTYTYGSGVYVQGVERAVAGAKIIRNTHANASVNPPSEHLAPGALGLTNCTSGTLKADVIENPGWYGVAVRDPNGEGNPGKASEPPFNPPGPDAAPNGRVVIDVGVIRNAPKASIFVRECPVVEVRATVENPRMQALLIADPDAYVGRSLTERVILHKFDVIGGAAVDGRPTGVAAIDCSAGALEYRTGGIRGYRGVECIYHSSEGELVLGDVMLDASKCTQGAIRTATSQDAGVRVAMVTGSIRGTTLRVTAVNAGYLRAGAIIGGNGIRPGTRIVRILSGAGGNGTYEVSAPQSIPSTAITARLPSESSRIGAAARIICNSRGQATNLNRPLRGLGRVTYIGAGRAPDAGAYKKADDALR